MAAPPSVDDFLRALSHPLGPSIERVRRVILACAPGVTEHVKWNAPSFCVGGDDRITFNLRGGELVLVFHRGARPKDATGFSFPDPRGLLEWRAPDRGLMTFRSAAAVDDALEGIADTARRWLEATAGDGDGAAPKRAPTKAATSAKARPSKKRG